MNPLNSILLIITKISIFQINTTMNSIENKHKVNFRYFINLALENELSWECVAIIFDELTSNLALSKQLNKILIQELKESESKHCKNPNEHSYQISSKVNKKDSSIIDTSNDSSELHYEEVGSSHVEIFFEHPRNEIHKIDDDKQKCNKDQENNIEFHQSDTKEIGAVENQKIITVLEVSESANIDETKHVEYNIEYDFVGSNGVETKHC